MYLREMITEALKANDFEGLYHEDMECGCTIEDLCPCDCPDVDNCVGGYRHMKDDGDWIVGPKKEEDLESGS